MIEDFHRNRGPKDRQPRKRRATKDGVDEPFGLSISIREDGGIDVLTRPPAPMQEDSREHEEAANLIDPSQPVVVIKEIVTNAGNVFRPRAKPYLPGEIPAQYLTSEYCTQTDSQEWVTIPGNTPRSIPRAGPIEIEIDKVQKALFLAKNRSIDIGEFELYLEGLSAEQLDEVIERLGQQS